MFDGFILSVQILFQLFISLTYFLLIPGLPLTIWLSRHLTRPHVCFALTPFISISVNFFLLYFLNFIGIRPPLVIYALILLTVSIVFLVRSKDDILVILRANALPALSAIPAAALSFYIWATSFAEYNFVAANQDAFNHNFWIARIAQVHSVMAADSFVNSPLQGLGTGSGFYPFSWHSAVAVAHSVGSVPIPILSLATTIVLWGFVLPLGLSALAREFAPHLKTLGLVAGVLVQLFPLVPGVPMSWGSMVSTIGIAFLPIGFLVVIIAFEKRNVISSLFAMFAFISLIFIHTPAAASLGVLAVFSSIAYLRYFKRKVLVKLLLAVAISMAPILILFRSYIFFDTESARLLFGAVYPFWENAIGSFMMMSVNVVHTPVLLTLLLIIGIAYVAYLRLSPALLLGTFGIFMIYLISGAPTGILNDLRIITTPWYASYERTAWVAVPFIALICAIPVCALYESANKMSRAQRTIGLTVAILIIGGVARQQLDATTIQLSNGPRVSEVVGKKDRPMLQRLKSTLNDDEIVYTFANDGSTYAFMYEEILTTSGRTFNRFGEESELIELVNNNIRTICSNPAAQAAITTEKIAAFVFGGRLLGWGPPGWQREDIESLGGLKLVDSGQYLFVAVPDFQNCPD